MLDNSFAQVLPSLVCLLIIRVTRLRIEHISLRKVRSKLLGNHGPSHELWNGEEFDQLRIFGDHSVPRIALNAVYEVGLFVVVGRKDDEVNDALEDLHMSGK